VKEVYLIRHGQTRENELGILIGQSDPSLSAQGREQVQALQSIIPVPDVVFSSDLRRASETARLLFPTHEISYLQQLRERSFGSLEGQSRSHTRDIRIHQITTSLEHQYGIESTTSLTTRICQVLHIIQTTSAKKIVVVGHGAFFRLMIEYLLPDQTPSITLKNGQYHHLTFGKAGQLIHAQLNQSWI
jgi:broad specificity phosphatase PhoE